jgi:allophanate hydrolase subunit 1
MTDNKTAIAEPLWEFINHTAGTGICTIALCMPSQKPGSDMTMWATIADTSADSIYERHYTYAYLCSMCGILREHPDMIIGLTKTKPVIRDSEEFSIKHITFALTLITEPATKKYQCSLELNIGKMKSKEHLVDLARTIAAEEKYAKAAVVHKNLTIEIDRLKKDLEKANSDLRTATDELTELKKATSSLESPTEIPTKRAKIDDAGISAFGDSTFPTGQS